MVSVESIEVSLRRRLTEKGNIILVIEKRKTTTILVRYDLLERLSDEVGGHLLQESFHMLDWCVVDSDAFCGKNKIYIRSRACCDVLRIFTACQSFVVTMMTDVTSSTVAFLPRGTEVENTVRGRLGQVSCPPS
jgi:hypothetical protein